MTERVETSDRVCFWCGGDAPTSKDHVFPRNLFPTPMPTDVVPITVPACDRHNGAFSRDEEYFREFVLASSYADPDAKALWTTKTRRALQRSPRYREMLARGIQDMDFKTPSGLHLGTVQVLVGDARRIELVLRKIVSGLHLHDFGTPLGFPPVGVRQLRRPDDLDPLRTVLASMEERRVGPVTFAFGRASDQPRAAIGVFFFFGHAVFAVYTHPEKPDVDDPLDAPPK